MRSLYLIFVLFQTVHSYFDCLDNYSLTTGLYAISNCTIENLEGNYEYCGSICYNNSNCVGFNYISLVNDTQCELLCGNPNFEEWIYSFYFEKTDVSCYVKTFHFMLFFVGGLLLIFVPLILWTHCKNRRYNGYHIIN